MIFSDIAPQPDINDNTTTQVIYSLVYGTKENEVEIDKRTFKLY